MPAAGHMSACCGSRGGVLTDAVQRVELCEDHPLETVRAEHWFARASPVPPPHRVAIDMPIAIAPEVPLDIRSPALVDGIIDREAVALWECLGRLDRASSVKEIADAAVRPIAEVDRALEVLLAAELVRKLRVRGTAAPLGTGHLARAMWETPRLDAVHRVEVPLRDRFRRNDAPMAMRGHPWDSPSTCVAPISRNPQFCLTPTKVAACSSVEAGQGAQAMLRARVPFSRF